MCKQLRGPVRKKKVNQEEGRGNGLDPKRTSSVQAWIGFGRTEPIDLLIKGTGPVWITISQKFLSLKHV